MKHIKYLLLLLALLVVPLMVNAQDDTIADIVVAATEADEPEFTILLQLVAAADLVETLSDPDASLTVFAPTDAAFQDALEATGLTLDVILGLPNLDQILLYHVAPGAVMAADVLGSETITTVQGEDIVVSIEEGSVILNGSSQVIDVDIEAANGIIHVIDGVLFPPSVAALLGGGEEEAATPTGSGVDNSTRSVRDRCIVVVAEEETVRVRVGPGINRTVVTYAPAGINLDVTGQNEVDGELWYRLDKDVAAPGELINEAWIRASEARGNGRCEAVPDTDAPPLIQISSFDEEDSDTSNTPATTTSTDTTSTGALPASGTYTVALEPFSNASCAGFDNVVFPTTESYSDVVFAADVVTRGNTIVFDGGTLTQSGAVYTGQFETTAGDGSPYVANLFLTPVNREFFVITFVASYTFDDGTACSDTTNGSATRQ